MQDCFAVLEFHRERSSNIRSALIDDACFQDSFGILNRQCRGNLQLLHRNICRGSRWSIYGQSAESRIVDIIMLVGKSFIGINLNRNVISAFRQTGSQDGAIAATCIYSAQVQSRQFLAVSQESDRNVDRSLITEIFHNCCDRELLESTDRVCRKLDITRRDFKIGSSGNRHSCRFLIIAFIRFRNLVIRINNCPDRITAVRIKSIFKKQFSRLASDQLRDDDTMAESRGAIEELDFHIGRFRRAVIADLHFECHRSIHIHDGRCRRDADQFQLCWSCAIFDRNRPCQCIIGAVGIFRNDVCAIGSSSYGPLSGDKRQIFKTQGRSLSFEKLRNRNRSDCGAVDREDNIKRRGDVNSTEVDKIHRDCGRFHGKRCKRIGYDGFNCNVGRFFRFGFDDETAACRIVRFVNLICRFRYHHPDLMSFRSEPGGDDCLVAASGIYAFKRQGS